MAYDLYTKFKVFNDQSLNVTCNIITNMLIEKYSKASIDQNFAVTGSVSKILQDEKISDVKCISFVTSQINYNKYLKNNISKHLGIKGIVMLSERMLITTDKCLIEIWKQESSIDIVDVNGIKCEDKTKISSNIL